MSSTLIAEIIMNEFDWSNIAVMVKEKQFPQTNFDVLLEEFKKFLLIKFIDRAILWTKYGKFFCSFPKVGFIIYFIHKSNASLNYFVTGIKQRHTLK